MPLLHVHSLSKRYGDTPVFATVDLTVASGEFVAILGESGVGKSTLLNCIAGLDTVDTGSVQIDGPNFTVKSSFVGIFLWYTPATKGTL